MNRDTWVRIPLGIFLIALVTLMVELLLIRVFDVVLFSSLAYMIISCALFAFGLAGVYVTLRPISHSDNVGKYLAWLSAALALACFVQLPLLNLNPFDLSAVPAHPLLQVFYFLLMYTTVVLPFFFAGLVLATAFSVFASQIRRLYFFDLVGAALGAVIIVPLIRPLGPGGLMFMAAALALIAAALFRGRTGFAAIATALAFVCAAVPLTHHGYYDFRPHFDKRGVEEAATAGQIERTVWDPVSKIDVIPVAKDPEVPDRVPYKHLAYDGGSQSTHLFSFSGDYASLRRELDGDINTAPRFFWNRAVSLCHWFKADTHADVLIIGSAGGQETKAALTYGAGHVDAVEMVRAVVDLVTGPYSHYIGDLFHDPRVSVHVDEGRTFLRRTKKKYDIIQINSNFTTGAIAYGIGTGDTSYLTTAEAYMEYFTHLKDDGILQMNQPYYPRMITTAALAWQRLGRSHFRDHVVVYERPGNDSLPTLLVKMTPWTAIDLARLNSRMLAPGSNKYRLMENPLAPAESFLSNEFFDRPTAADLQTRVDYQIAPSTDDWPYRKFIRRTLHHVPADPRRFVDGGTAFALNAHFVGPIPFDVVHYVVTGAASLLFALIFIFVPLLGSPTGRIRWPHKAVTMVYFSCLGAGFIIIELTLIQIFIKLVGVPLYTYSTVIFTMLLAAGVGSLSADRLDISPRRGWPVPFGGLLLFGMLLVFVHAAVFGVFLGMPLAVRIAVAVAMIFPLGFFMGMPLPLGILAIAQQPRGAVAWGWAMNGLFTVVGGLVAAIGSIVLGFKLILLSGFAIYIGAALAFVRLRHMPAAAPEVPAAEADQFVSGGAKAA